MKIITRKKLIFILVLSWRIIYAQTDSTHVFSRKSPYWGIGFSAGVALPNGNFASKNIQNNNAGLAKTGFNLETSAYILLTKRFGFCGLYKYTSNPIDNVAYTPDARWNTISTPWKMNLIFFGLYETLTLNKHAATKHKINIDLRAMAGYVKETSPNMTTTNVQGNFHSIYAANTHSLGYLLSLGFRYPICKNVYVKINADYFKTYANFYPVQVSYNINFTANELPMPKTISQNISALLFNGGFVILF